MIEKYGQLTVYQRSYDLAKEIHGLTAAFPKFEQYELGSQMRRASGSIPANIAEGFGKNDSRAEFVRFLRMGMGSANEMLVWLDFAKEYGYITAKDHDALQTAYEHLAKQLNRLIEKLQAKEFQSKTLTTNY